MMKSHFDSVKVKVLTVAIVVFLAIPLSGCIDPIASDMEAEHRQLGNMVQQELQKCPSAYPPGSQTEALFPTK
jgi:hypothetical protein